MKTQREGELPYVWGVPKLPCPMAGVRRREGGRGGHICRTRSMHGSFGDSGGHMFLGLRTARSPCVFLYSAHSLSCPLSSIRPPSFTLPIPLPPWKVLCLPPSLQVRLQPCLLLLPLQALAACLVSVPGPVLTSMQDYSPQRYAELLEPPNYVWHLLLPLGGCPELYMQYVLEDVQRINF